MIYNRASLFSFFLFSFVCTLQRPLVVWSGWKLLQCRFLLYIEHHMVFYEVPRHRDQSDCTEKKRKSTYPSSRTVRNKHVSYNQRGLNLCSNQDDSVTFVPVTTTASNFVHCTSGNAHRSYGSWNYKARGLGRPSGCHLNIQRVIQLID